MDYVKLSYLTLKRLGKPCYEGLKQKYPVHFSSFSALNGRCKRKKLENDFPRTKKGFEDFIEYIGPIPKGMKWPSVGRLDHKKGYIKGNFRWQEMSENSADHKSWMINNKREEIRKLVPSIAKYDKLVEFLKNLDCDFCINGKVCEFFDYTNKKIFFEALRNAIKKNNLNLKIEKNDKLYYLKLAS